MKDYSARKYVLVTFIMLSVIILLFRLFYMQVVDDYWKVKAVEITTSKEILYPPRGVVYDRNGNRLIGNEIYYDVFLTHSEAKGIDSVRLCELLEIPMSHFVKRRNWMRRQSAYVPADIVKSIKKEKYYSIAHEIQNFPGITVKARLLRTYPHKAGAQLLGFMNEVGDADIENDPSYRAGDYIGRRGIEKSYEDYLRGRRGVRHILKDAIGNVQGLARHKLDTAAIPGANLTMSLDIALQAYGEQLMRGKTGSIVAIEPATGEVLAMVSSPNFDPNILVGRDQGKYFQELIKEESKPLLTRASNSMYPPGSTFKTVQALVALQEGVITVNTGFPCNKGLLGCHGHPQATNVVDAVKMSCNPYFYQVMNRVIDQDRKPNNFDDTRAGYTVWRDYMRSFGITDRLDIDLPPGEVAKGKLPDVDYFDRKYNRRWNFHTIYSLSIGQGEVNLSPLHMANIAAIIANRGWYITPHLVKDIEGQEIPEKYRTKKYTKVETKYFEPIVEGMRRVVEEGGGTARRARIDGYTVCGKTGTAQNPHGEDHSVFIAFAPKDDPKIAISVYVENAGFGGTWAAPIASLMIEKYLRGTVTDKAKEQRILDARFNKYGHVQAW